MFDPANPFGTVQNIDSMLTPNIGNPQFPVSFGEDAKGNLYITYLVTGDVYRIRTSVIPEPHTIVLALACLGLWFTRQRRG
jgi:hypothetical protein